jgi:hypothetical protein
LLDLMADLFLDFLGACILFFIVVVLAHTRVLFSLHPHQHLLLFLMVAILTGLRWNLNVVLICISFMTRDGEHFFHVFF